MGTGNGLVHLRVDAVLVVDRSATCRERLIHGLQRFFGKVEGAQTASEALFRIRAASFDALVLDLSPADGQGLEPISILQEVYRELRVVLVTGCGSVASSVRAIKLGAADYLIKPVSPGRVAAALIGNSTPVLEGLVQEMSLDLLMWEHIHQVLHDSDGNISEAARRLRIHRQSLQRKLRKAPPRSEPY